ncbi:MAG: TonB-dependent receptor [Aureispira sp.]|nr:TonB-dependent receptor [Aureispira sp.]
MLSKKLISNFFFLGLFLVGIHQGILGQGDIVLEQNVSINIKNKSIAAALTLLEEKNTDLHFVFDASRISLDKRINLSVKKKKVKWVLAQIFAETPIDFKVFGTQITLYNNPDKVQPLPLQFTISGYLIDFRTNDPLIGATIFEPITSRGTTSNIEGFYSLTLPKGKHQIVCSYIGYESITTLLDLARHTKLNVNLNEGAEMSEIVVESSEHLESRHELNVISSNAMDIKLIKSLPSMLGEADVIKAMQLLPGVQSGSEGASGLFVRGGGPDQNLFLLDGVPVYNANHLFGFVSIFDSKIIKKATIIKGGFPARYGGRLSSVLDIQTRTGDMQKFHGEISIGLLSGGFSIEGPIWKGKTSFLVSARRSWVDLFGVPIQQAIVNNNNGSGNVINYSFYDINVKLKHKFSDKNYLILNGYFGDDFFNYKQTSNLSFDLGPETLTKSISNEDQLQWGNKIIALHWHTELSQKLFMKVSATYSNYFYESKTESYAELLDEQGLVIQNEEFESEGRTPIHDVSGQVAFDYIPHNKHYVRFGFGYTYHLFRPEISKSTFSFGGVESEIENFSNIHEFTAFIEDDIRIGKILKINPGIHIADFFLKGRNYFSLQPRLSVNLLVTKQTSIKASYARMTQFVHLLTNPGIGLPTDLWLPTTKNVPPEHSHQWSLGVTQDLPLGLEFTTEGFYKIMENVLEYNPSTNFLQDRRSWESLVEIGRGESYGAEVLLQRKKGKFTGWISYTLSWSWRKFKKLNRGRQFPYRYDRRHDVSVVLNYKFNKNWDVGLIWVYGTGHPVTLGLERYIPIQAQVGHYNASNNPLQSTGTIVSDITNIVDRNNFRMPPYHRMDVTVNWNKKLKHGSQTLSLGIYNVYNQLNPYMVVPKEGGDGTLKLYQVSILPIMPSISYARRW